MVKWTTMKGQAVVRGKSETVVCFMQLRKSVRLRMNKRSIYGREGRRYGE